MHTKTLPALTDTTLLALLVVEWLGNRSIAASKLVVLTARRATMAECEKYLRTRTCTIIGEATVTITALIAMVDRRERNFVQNAMRWDDWNGVSYLWQ